MCAINRVRSTSATSSAPSDRTAIGTDPEGPAPDTAEPVLDGPPLALLLGALLLGALLLGALLLGAPPLGWSLIDPPAGRLGAGAGDFSGDPPGDDIPNASSLAFG
ncbi:MAG: hypothetical protein WKF57_03370 [Nakamurella sp.]